MSFNMKNFNMQGSLSLRLRMVFVMTLVVVLAACSSIKLSYNHGDTLLYWWLDAYVDLDSGQKEWVEADIDKLFKWHRETQLQDYVQVLSNGQRQLKGTVTQADLLADYDDIKRRSLTVVMKAAPDLADLARSLQPEQIAQLQKKFASNNDDYRKKFLSGSTEKRQAYRYKKSMEQFELWFGNFSSEQESVIRKASDARPLDNQIWLDERMRRQNNVLKLVQTVQRDKLSKEATVTLVQGLIKDSIEPPANSEHKAFFDATTTSTLQLVLTVINIATPAQKAHADQRMQGWINDFKTLAADQH